MLPTDVIGWSGGHLTHVDCARAQVLTPEERTLLLVYCIDHIVAQCAGCGRGFRMTELASDLGSGRTKLCATCRVDLTEHVRVHLYGCAMLPSEVRLRATEVRDAARKLVKRSQQARDRSDVLLREAEALLFVRQQILRAVMAKRATS
jgi:hypothetical protein